MFYPTAKTAIGSILRAAPSVSISQIGKANGRSVSGQILSIHLRNNRNYSTLLSRNHQKVQYGLNINITNNCSLKASPILVSMMANKRFMSIQEVTKNIKLLTGEPRNVEKDVESLKLTQDTGDKPLAVLLSWLQARPKHLRKYAKLYLDQGFDVAVISINPWQLLWPSKGSQYVANDLVKFLFNNPYYQQVVLHGFSVGAYVWSECMVHMQKDLTKYQQLFERICGQVWDSAADITEIPVGVPKALFPRNQPLQKALKQYMLYHLKTFHEPATQHYIRGSQMFHTNLIHAPALFFVSKTDPVGAEESNIRVRDSWISMGINVTWKCFDRSPHVQHFMKHRDEYVMTLFNFLQSINMIKYPELMQIRAKL
jgi:hypothetical protein